MSSCPWHTIHLRSFELISFFHCSAAKLVYHLPSFELLPASPSTKRSAAKTIIHSNCWPICLDLSFLSTGSNRHSPLVTGIFCVFYRDIRNQVKTMHLPTLALAALTAAIPALAFTNGSLVPAYMCNPTPDGLPKNYGELLSYTREMTGPIAFNANRLAFPSQPHSIYG